MPQSSRSEVLPGKSEEREDLVPEAHEEGKTVFIDSLTLDTPIVGFY